MKVPESICYKERQVSILLFVTAIVLFIFFELTSIVHAQMRAESSLARWDEQQVIIIEERAAQFHQNELEVQGILKQAQSALTLSRELEDEEAAAIAQEAIDIANEGLKKISAQLQRNDMRLVAVIKIRRWGVQMQNASLQIGVSSMIKGDVRIRKKTLDPWEFYDGNAPPQGRRSN